MARIVSIGDDGVHQRRALERLATGHIASVFGNHCAPVLQWLTYENVTFAIFPMLSNGDPSGQWAWEDVGDVLDSVLQMIEVRRAVTVHGLPRRCSDVAPVEGCDILSLETCGPSCA